MEWAMPSSAAFGRGIANKRALPDETGKILAHDPNCRRKTDNEKATEGFLTD
jgi:hypothetical protein